MGTIQHDAVIATGYADPEKLRLIEQALAEFRSGLPNDLKNLVVGPVVTHVNGSVHVVWLPDGSKEGWETSDDGDRCRELFIGMVKTWPDYWRVVHISYGEHGERLTVID